MSKLLSVIAPMYNEEPLVEEYCDVTLNVLRTIEGYTHEIILVNDGSSDNTYYRMLEIQKKYPDEIGVACLSRNFGLEGAIDAGLRVAQGDVVVTMDADLQDPPELIIEMLKKVEQGAEVVVGSRIKRSNDSAFKKVSAGLYYSILDYLSGKLKLEKNAANYRMLTRKALNQWLELPEANGVYRVTVPYIGMPTATVEYDRNKRAAGKTKYNLKSMMKYAIDSMTGISVEPLNYLFWMMPVCFMIFISSVFGLAFTRGFWQVGWMVVFFISILFGLLYISVSVIGIYIGQITLESKHRPLSIIYRYEPSGNAVVEDIL